MCFCQDELMNQEEDPERNYSLTYVDEDGIKVER